PAAEWSESAAEPTAESATERSASDQSVWKYHDIPFRRSTHQSTGWRTAAKYQPIRLRGQSADFEPARQTSMSFSTIQFHPGPRVASIVLNRPPLNIINVEMLDELNAAWSEVEDLKAQVAVISSAGDRAFSAGVDVADHMPGKIESMIEKFHHLIRRIR